MITPSLEQEERNSSPAWGEVARSAGGGGEIRAPLEVTPGDVVSAVVVGVNAPDGLAGVVNAHAGLAGAFNAHAGLAGAFNAPAACAAPPLILEGEFGVTALL